MKIFTVATLAAFCASASARSCSTTKTKQRPNGTPCPTNYRCVITQTPASNGPNKGFCAYKKPTGIDYNRANRAFSAADIDHNRKITFGGAYKALQTLEPRATEAMLDSLTKHGDKNRNGYIDYSEFITLYRVIEDKLKNNGNPNNKCAAAPCAKNQTCRNCKNTKGYCCENIVTVPASTTAHGQLTAKERATVNNIFSALNTNHDKGVSRQEFYQLLLAVRSTMGHDTVLYGEVYRYVMQQGDKNHDSILEYKEFLDACTTLKAKDPAGFPKFLAAATKLKPLNIGDPCVKSGWAAKPCPKAASCERERVQVHYGTKGQTYTTYKYFCVPATTTQKPVMNIKAGQKCTYGSCKSGCRKCAKGLQCRRMAYHYGQVETTSNGICSPTNCKACTTAKGTWSQNRCVFGQVGTADGVMFTTPKQCDHYDAARKARCWQYHDCKTCLTKSKNKLGLLCGWRAGSGFGGGSGSCQPNYGGGMVPLTTSTGKCQKVVHVNGRE